MNYIEFLLATKAGIGKPGQTCRLFFEQHRPDRCANDSIALVEAIGELRLAHPSNGACEVFDNLPRKKQLEVIDRAIYIYQQQAL